MNTHLGNDIVSLETEEAREKAADGRFVSRVFNEGEQRTIREAADPATALWQLWAAKEAVFKVLRKEDPTLGFSPEHFTVDYDRATVSAGKAVFPVQWLVTDVYVHCLATSVAQADRLASAHLWVEPTQAFSGELTAREKASAFVEPSVQVRLLAKEKLRELGWEDAEIVRPKLEKGFGPPIIYRGESPVPGCDISLSHDGDWLAVAVLLPGRD